MFKSRTAIFWVAKITFTIVCCSIEVRNWLIPRSHKSFIVAKDKIKQIEGNRILIDKYKVPIGQTYKENIMMLL
ncbi:LytTR family transcriptional regulator DNA-binding domain-containing protein [Flavobacterium flavigenum]|uniref:LytTR family transcriptional regulator DNA-binding domain-containing protein n=1 Tax=Flavobacterium flavigenum TaxID=3003258 RepID=UPI003D7A2718